MFDIAGYLQKFKKLSEARKGNREAVSEAIQTVCGISILPTDIVVKNSIARIQQKPIIKGEIFMKKDKILTYLQEKSITLSDIL